MRARHIIDRVQDNVKYFRGFRDRDDCLGVLSHGFRGKETIERVSGGREQEMRVHVEKYRIRG